MIMFKNFDVLVDVGLQEILCCIVFKVVVYVVLVVVIFVVVLVFVMMGFCEVFDICCGCNDCGSNLFNVLVCNCGGCGCGCGSSGS